MINDWLISEYRKDFQFARAIVCAEVDNWNYQLFGNDPRFLYNFIREEGFSSSEEAADAVERIYDELLLKAQRLYPNVETFQCASI